MSLSFVNNQGRLDAQIAGSLAAFYVSYYDYLLTLSDEIQYLWNGQRGAIYVLYILNRYSAFLGSMPFALHPFIHWSPRWCFIFRVFCQVYVVFVFLVSNGILILRTYALYDRNKKVLFILVTNASMIIVAGAWSFTQSKAAPSIARNCNLRLTAHDAERLLVPWLVTLAHDSFIFGITLWRTISMWRMENNVYRLLHLLMRDGIFLFVGLLISNLANVLPLALVGVGSELSAATTAAYSATKGVLISRMVLNIQQLNPQTQPELETDDSEYPVMSTRVLLTSSTSASGDQTTV